MSGSYRPLLPATASTRRREPSPEPKKSKRIAAACNACRLRKTRCNGGRPKCKVCIERNTTCHYRPTAYQNVGHKYDELKAQKTRYEELLDLIISVSEPEAQGILARLRSGASPETLLSHAATGDALLQLALAPETRYRYDFPYIKEMPESLFTNSNPYLQSSVYEFMAINPVSRSAVVGEDVTQPCTLLATSKIPQLQNVDRETYESAYLKPFHAAEVIDPLLSNAKFSLWTTVCDNEVLMRNLFSTWLLCEYQFTAIFQKDLFLEDMVSQREEFCSSLLVNIILGYSCISYSRFTDRAEYWNPNTLTYRFIAEAKRLWELQSHQPRVTTVQAGILFNVFYNLCGIDEVGQAYRIQAIALADQMCLFRNSTQGLSPRACQGLGFTAWALYNWETLVGFSFLFAPLLNCPPQWDLPDPLNEPDWYGEVWVKYPLSGRLVPLSFGQVIKGRSEFRVIMNEACQVAYKKDSTMTLSKANELLSRLRSWYNGLPEVLTPRFIVFPGHLQLHMYYQHLILTIFEPLLEAKTDQTPSLHQIVAQARAHLQTLVRLYYLRHGYDAMDLFIVIPLMLHASDCIDAIVAANEQTPTSELESLRSTLILATKGLQAQCQNHRLAKALFYVIRGRMRPSELALFKGILDMDKHLDDDKFSVAQEVRSNWPVSIVKHKEDVGSYVLTNLVESFVRLNVEEEEG
ncbi:putative C6 transcription factor [Periconia macrospinosa]|uniref:Putative C6 transcription factor n=1 Tax=Periconia macrospinosa TaxID=97972 RepID=A0A2V1DBF7_9PLEO|nr:putative C6 transcription factor [Periconia macrospinosa]